MPADLPSPSSSGVHARGFPFIFEAAGIVLLALVSAAVSNSLAGPERRLEWRQRAAVSSRPSAPSSVPVSAQASGPSAAPSPAAPWKEISAAETESLFRSGVLFLDARRSSEYREGHIAGARSVPVWEAGLDDKVKALFQERTDQSAPIVVYCNGGECEDSHELAQKLYLAGFDSVRVYRDGFPDWSRRKLPSTTGDRP